MGIRQYKPTSAGRRGASVSDFAELTKGAKPEKSLLQPKKKTGGRNNQGKITARHRGGGHKRQYRVIDFRRDKDGVPARVASIQYDPNRSARIALLHYVDGEKRYILAPEGLQVGTMLESGPEAAPNVGNCLPVRKIPLGSSIHNIELLPGLGGCLCRSAGSSATLGGAGSGLGADHACPAVKFAVFPPSAGRRSARWGTRITWRSRSARPAGIAGWVGVLMCVVRR